MSWYLTCSEQSHEKILLKNDVKTSVGRTPQTGITDKRCSRNQIELTANYSNKTVLVKQCGSNSSFIGDKEIKKGETGILSENEILYLIKDNYPHQIVCISSNESSDMSKTLKKKRNINDYFSKIDSSSKKLKVDLEESSDGDQEKEESVKSKLQLLQQDKTTTVSAPDVNLSPALHTSSSSRSPGWYKDESSLLIYETEGLKHSSKVVAFDMDGTLITTKSGKTFAIDHKDWKILYSEIPKKLKDLLIEDHKLVIITNQLGIGKGKVKEVDFKIKVENIVKTLDVPFQVFAITNRGKYRKPNIGTWHWLMTQGNGGIAIDSFIYVGDAAGRPKNWAPGKKKDFSASDRLFAINLNVPFYTPEEYFLSHKAAKYELPEFDPRNFKDKSFNNDAAKIDWSIQELIILVGYPASGKSTFANTYLASHGYVVINRDKLKTWQKCVAACDQALGAKKSVVVDNTNPDAESRLRYINVAKKHECQCRCFVMDVSIEHAMHNNRFRELSGSEHDVVPRMVLYSYRKKYEKPNINEGFSEIININFTPQFADESLERYYFMFTD